MTLFDHVKFILSKPPRGQIKFIVTTDIDGILSKRFYGKSLVGNFLQGIYGYFNGNDTADFAASGSPWNSVNLTKTTTAGTQAFYGSTSALISANVGAVDRGLILGSGSTAVAAADYVIETLIANGTGSGQLSYQSQTAPQGCEIVSLTTSFILERLFVNNSAGNVSVNEIALYVKLSSVSTMIYRDVLSSADVIPSGSTYRVTLEISITS
jgi:hypothetical protein